MEVTKPIGLLLLFEVGISSRLAPGVIVLEMKDFYYVSYLWLASAVELVVVNCLPTWNEKKSGVPSEDDGILAAVTSRADEVGRSAPKLLDAKTPATRFRVTAGGLPGQCA